jgi:hypothetical protein
LLARLSVTVGWPRTPADLASNASAEGAGLEPDPVASRTPRLSNA